MIYTFSLILPSFPPFFCVEQTETELPRLEQLPPKLTGCIVLRSCVDLCCWFFFVCLFSFVFPWIVLERDLCIWNAILKSRCDGGSFCCYDTSYVFYAQVCIFWCACGPMSACPFVPKDGRGGNFRCTCCHSAVISLAGFSWIITLPLLAPLASKHGWDETQQCFVVCLSETPHPPPQSGVGVALQLLLT